ncbi:MAG: replication-relaxation family protein [Pseudonocardiaceae bacterium]
MSVRVSGARLRLLADELTERYTAPLPHLARARLLTGAQLDRLLADPELSPETVGRVRRRIMTRLHRAGLVAMLGRRVGGVRAGSVGHVYALTSAGHTFLALLRGESSPGRVRHSATPGPLFLAHALTISGIYVDLIEHSRQSRFQVANFATEPHCWHPTGNGAYLRPDAYTALRTTTHADYWWLEVDQSTESPPRLRAKARIYRQFLTSGGIGPDGYPPRVLITAPDAERAHTARRAVTSPTGEDDGALITVTTHHHAAQFMTTELQQP